MKLQSLVLIGLIIFALTTPAMAEVGTIDNVPAATLLLPYFEVDLTDSSGVTTLFSINNASAAAALTHVTIWSNLSVPIIDFDVYLTGYDVQTINLRDIIVNGILPSTASAGQDPGDDISPQGSLSQDINYASCAGFLPYGPISATFLAHIQAALSGLELPLFPGQCASFGDGFTATGYVTVDAVSVCSQQFPGEPGYFIDGGLGVATDDNVLWGDFFIIDQANAFAQGFNLVHIEADSALGPCLPGTTPETFYCRYSLGEDDREALGSVFATRYLSGGAFDGGTNLLVYRDSNRSQNVFACGTAPPWFPLSQNAIVVFDEEENTVTVQSGGPSGEPQPGFEIPFPQETNRTLVGGPTLSVPFSAGWLYLDLSTTVVGAFGPEAQSYVLTSMSASGLFSVGVDAIQLNNLTFANLAGLPPGN